MAACSLVSMSAFDAPTMGWSSWNTYRVNISDSLIVSQARAMVSLGLDTLGYRYINIDDGFQGGRDASTGRLLVNPHRFPGGLKPVVDAIHALGLKAGTYTDAGRNTCGNFSDGDTLSVNVGLYGHEEQDCRYYFDTLGFDFIKIDYCGALLTHNRQHVNLDPETQYRRIASAVAATDRGDSIRVNVCRWDYPGTWVSDVATSWRISGDIWCEWARVKEIIDQNLYLSAYARNGRYNDMDMLEVGRTLTPEQDRTHMAIWCMMASPLLIGCDLTTLRPETLELLSNPELVAIDQDPLGRQAHVVHADANGGYVLARDLGELYGLRRAVAFYNPTDSAIVLETTLADLELTGPAPARNACNRAYLGTVEGRMSITLQSHQTEVYTLIGRSRLPRTVYEAETARLGAYQELYNPEAVCTAYYYHNPILSGGVGVRLAGVTPVNDIMWDDVYAPADGDYDLAVTYIAGDESEPFYISVNDGDGFLVSPQVGDGSSVVTSVVRLPLSQGVNTVRLYGTGRLPVVDRLTVNP